MSTPEGCKRFDRAITATRSINSGSSVGQNRGERRSAFCHQALLCPYCGNHSHGMPIRSYVAMKSCWSTNQTSSG